MAHTCLPIIGVRRVWRASALASGEPPRQPWPHDICPKHCYTWGLVHMRVPHMGVHNVWRARPGCHPVGPLVVHRPSAKRTLKRPDTVIETHLLRPNRPSPRPTAIINNPAHGQQQSTCRSGRICSVGGRAMHMKLPDGIGREAGSGKTRHVQELSLSRACPL